MKMNRRKLLSLIGMSPAVLASSPTFAKGTETAKAASPAGSGQVIETLNPRGAPPPIKLLQLAPRLDSLDGKTVYLVDTGFMGGAALLHEMENWFAKNMLNTKIVYRKKAGPYPENDPVLWKEIKANGNAAIMAIGHCSGCTPATITHCITVEQMGVPTVPVVTSAYHDLAKLNAAKKGMPLIRTSFTPHPVWGKTPEELDAYIAGPDPISGKPLMKEIVASLTTPVTDDEKKTGEVTISVGPPTFKDTARNLQEFYLNNNMTDYLPIILPTQDLVDEMLKGTSHHPDEPVGKMAAGFFAPWTYNVRQVAVNAVMAGAKPEYFPVILAIASSGQASLSSSTNSFAMGAVINGPIRDKLDMNYGIGAMGPFAQSNATIGRVWTLLSKNLGNGGIPGDSYGGSQGNNLNYNNLIIAENEQDSPWVPLHVQKGHKPEENVVTLFEGLGIASGEGGTGGGVLVNPPYDKQMASVFNVFISLFGGLVVMDPLVAKGLHQMGYDTKEKLINYIYENSKHTVKEYKETTHTYTFEYPRALRGEEPYATWYKSPDDTIIPRWPKPEAITLVVAGGQANAFFQAGNMSSRGSISIDKWM
jgi:hypothetical protein